MGGSIRVDIGNGVLRRAFKLLGITVLVTAAAAACKSGNGGGGGSDTGTPSSGGGGAAPTAAIANLHDKGVVHTGFVVGTAEASATLVSVSLDGAAYSPATGTASWKYKLPTGSNTWADGSSHTIAVKASDGTNESAPVTITVRKSVNMDVNGDGYADLAVGANHVSTNAGAVYVFHSTGTGGITATTAVDGVHGPQTTITGEATSIFGTVVRLADINGDGYADLIVGAQLYNSSQGRVYVFLADSNGGGITATTATAGAGGPNTTITGEAASDNFGISIAVGDVNKDGYADLIVGADQAAGFKGVVYVFHSSSSGISATTAVTGAGGPSDTITGENVSDHFGAAVDTGDVTGDGYADVIASGYGYSSGAGRVYVLHSSGTSGGITTAAAASANTKIDGEAGSNFGSSLAAGDITGDGHADVAVGAYFYPTGSGTGRAYVFHASNTGSGISSTAATSADRVLTGEGTPHYFGGSVAIGDVNGDGYDDLIVGAYRFGNYQGKVYVFHASNTGSGISATTSSSGAGGPNGTITGIASNTEFSYSLACVDLNGDGHADVVTSALLNSSGGQAFVFNADNAGGGILQTTAVSGAGGPSTAISAATTSDGLGISLW